MYSAALFDMDGLLLDSERPTRDAWEAVLVGCGLAFDQQFYLTAVGRNLADTRLLFGQWYGEDFDFDSALAQVRQTLSDTTGIRGYAVKPGANELLAELANRGIPAGIASSTARDRVGLRLKQAGLLGHFQSLAGGNEVRCGKPEPDIFLLAAERLGVAPETCLVFEDSSFGAQGALAAGMGVVVVPDLKSPTAYVKRRALRVLGSLAESLEFLDDWFCGMS